MNLKDDSSMLLLYRLFHTFRLEAIVRSSSCTTKISTTQIDSCQSKHQFYSDDIKLFDYSKNKTMKS